MAEVRKHPAVIAFDAWLKANTGTIDPTTLGFDEARRFLLNRIEHAFMAGYMAGEQSR